MNPFDVTGSSLVGYGSLPQPEALPDFGLGPLGSMLLQAGISSMGGRQALGWSNPANPFTAYSQQQNIDRHNKLMQDLASTDDSAVAAYRSFARAAGFQENSKVMQSIQNSQVQAAKLLGPMMASDSAVQMFDMVTGGRSKMALGKYVSDIGRYQFDPTTGNWGYSAQSTKALTDAIFNEYGGANRSTKAYGLGAGDIGSLTRELMAAGFIGEGSGNTPGSKLTNQTDKIKAGIDSHVKAISALREIFGEAGQPDAPMQKLLGALDQFAGGRQQISAGRLEGIVRGMRNAADISGISLQQMGSLLSMNSQQLTAQGINAAFAAPITQQQMLLRGALNAQGTLSTPAWGLLSADQLSGMYAHQLKGAVGSSLANMLGAAQRLGQKSGFAGNADGTLLRQALDEAQRGIVDGPASRKLASMTADKQRQVFAGGLGLTSAIAEQELSAKSANQEQINISGLQTQIAAMQPYEVLGRLFSGTGRATASVRMQALLGGKISSAKSAELGGVVSQAIFEAVRSMPASTRHDPAKREAAMMAAAKAALAPYAGDSNVAAMLGNNQWLSGMASAVYNSANEEYSRRNGGVDLVNFLAINSPEVLKEKMEREKRVQTMSRIQSLMGGVPNTPGMRIMNALLSYGDDQKAGFADKLFEAMNVSSYKKLSDQTKTLFEDIVRDRGKLDKQFFDENGKPKGGLTDAEASKRLKEGYADLDKRMQEWIDGTVGDDKDKEKELRQQLVDEFNKQSMGTADAARGVFKFVIDTLKLSAKGGEITLKGGEGEGEGSGEGGAAKDGTSVDDAPVEG